MTLIVLCSSLRTYARIDSAIVEHYSVLPSLMEGAWQNPALIDAHYKLSLSDVGIGYHNNAKERYGYFRANSYIHIGNITMQAKAEYQNGNLPKVDYETVDAAIVHPYHTFDSIRGKLNLERYSFGGECDVRLRRWSVGVRLCYDAGLYYRNVDPRPRNVTGLLNIGGAASYSVLANYRVGVEAGYFKYKQSSDITFMSELGETTIYHLTGLGMRYERFTGLGKTTYYNGYGFSGSLTLLPTERGVYANAGGRIFKNTHMLVDLNKLPLARTDERSAFLDAGWHSNGGGFVVKGFVSERHGYENIFGDAVTGQYPQIGSLGMYEACTKSITAEGALVFNLSQCVISALPKAQYLHFIEKYTYPILRESISLLALGSGARFVTAPSNGCVFRADVEIRGVRSNVDWRGAGLVNAGLSIPLQSKKFAISIDLAYAHDSCGINQFSASAAFQF